MHMQLAPSRIITIPPWHRVVKQSKRKVVNRGRAGTKIHGWRPIRFGILLNRPHHVQGDPSQDAHHGGGVAPT